MKKTTLGPLSSWIALNKAVRRANEETCKELLREELRGLNRIQFMLRIHSRLNKVRADRERLELGK